MSLLKNNVQLKQRRKHHFSPYILGLWLIWSLHFSSSQLINYYESHISILIMKEIHVKQKNFEMIN